MTAPAFPARHETTRRSGTRTEGDLLRQAFRRRATHAIEHISRLASLDALAQALEAPTDFGAIAAALGGTAMPEAARDLDPLADAVARGAGERERLVAAAGGLLSATEAGRVLGGISRQAVDKRRRGNQVLAVRLGGDWRYPAAQFGPDGQVPALLPSVLQDAAGLGMSGWAILDFLLAPDTALRGSSPLDVLRRNGPDTAGVRRLLAAAGADAFG
jgi:hypothetical protein